ncbi:MAG: hypothetical protein XE11_0835 [Methanomicrobiales archaeon 53_19]|uniref:hypothetical protein n=1 Tax=Methanocalculus sp. TaxID=2004547 RepID=UPI000749C8B0|nr:hypothetical protein [Methanocalculus sp.]KUK71488.1 MAG: hypothetical protein XD88_0040 [Methanocalculus sp. 52_23]KUL04110.1 MAG: hypothetical protein XE11_0835 [Methanomicrobiales archaeon 53_19]HIJ07392.1 hypothetical protein [Methanocalculus sp.]
MPDSNLAAPGDRKEETQDPERRIALLYGVFLVAFLVLVLILFNTIFTFHGPYSVLSPGSFVQWLLIGTIPFIVGFFGILNMRREDIFGRPGYNETLLKSSFYGYLIWSVFLAGTFLLQLDFGWLMEGVIPNIVGFILIFCIYGLWRLKDSQGRKE